MTQNIYDNPDFFAGYSQLGRSVHGLDGAGEWPALRAMLPDIAGRDVLDLGCGFGWFCRWARQAGAAHVHGIDVSENMLARARQTEPDPAVTYARGDLETIDLPRETYDLAYSSLALHYIVRLDRLLAAIHATLRPGGTFVFSAEHPIFTAPSRPGWTTHPDGHKIWPLDGYSAEGPRETNWLAPGVIKQHRTLATTLTLLLQAGFTLTQIQEWNPTDEQIAATPTLAPERDRPPFVLVGVRK
jgi:SAM-dependent methyltransferase